MKSSALLIAVAVFSGCTSGSNRADVDAEAARLMKLSRDWSQLAGTGDIEATLSHWADDAVMMPPGQPPLRDVVGA